MTGRLAGKVAIITGGSSGIGEGTARAFAREGAKVILLARQEEKGRVVEAAIRHDGGEATFIGCDVTDDAAVAAAVHKAVATYGAINILFNKAGGGAVWSLFPNEPIEEFNRIIHLNLMGTFYMSQAVWPHLIEAGGGAVINMSSIAAQRGMSPVMYEEFGASYFGLLGFDSRCRSADALHGRDWGQTPHSSQLRASRSDHDGESHG